MKTWIYNNEQKIKVVDNRQYEYFTVMNSLHPETQKPAVIVTCYILPIGIGDECAEYSIEGHDFKSESWFETLLYVNSYFDFFNSVDELNYHRWASQ